MLKVGISACFFHPDPARATFSKKTLLYFEQSMAHWVLNHGAYPILLPTESDKADVAQIMSFVDGLLLHGGADVAPESYGEKAFSERWPGDRIRDQYEIKLYQEARRQGKPVLGICRGLQVINVAEGGTLFQDIQTQNEKALQHRDADKYDGLFHQVTVEADSCLAALYGEKGGKVNSVHHQAVKDLAPTLVVEARCPEDDIIEGFRHEKTKWDGPKEDFVLAVQWHPEFMQTLNNETLSESKLMSAFLQKLGDQ
ncbi:MAG: gamma-glutamyl-gamma-aminobutyrate hydrolase family protein [Bdellovibrionaceae bacterium]|nr:gamma-glutamyl-gamma-aminobutyrate hydrolase family protein [Bdellovibrionales bacterium]MCB9084146.1 gamma-glutamyl-gamma-aminobutyrate hydrolase family protein [Pseudobdellovibrionaceae bacterium]